LSFLVDEEFGRFDLGLVVLFYAGGGDGGSDGDSGHGGGEDRRLNADRISCMTRRRDDVTCDITVLFLEFCLDNFQVHSILFFYYGHNPRCTVTSARRCKYMSLLYHISSDPKANRERSSVVGDAWGRKSVCRRAALTRIKTK
jgi:hypothetical protein